MYVCIYVYIYIYIYICMYDTNGLHRCVGAATCCGMQQDEISEIDRRQPNPWNKSW